MLKLYNSLTRVKDEFKPLTAGKVGLYTCGPTVYNYLHIGNYRTYIIWDVLKRLLSHHGLKVKHVMNITDVGHLVSDADEGEDKMELAKLRERKTAWEIAEFFIKSFEQDAEAFNIITPDRVIRATATIKEQIALALKLDAAGYLYQISDGMYFDTSKLKDYGKLARLSQVDLKEGARVEFNKEKKNPSDFAVWKFSPKDSHRDMEWESPWGKGFPGWHLECSAISMEYLGDTFDIHTGGVDHLTVHHPNEMAQSEAVSGKPLANWWMHSEFLTFGDQKMSKSAGTFVTLEDLKKKGISPLAFRYYILQTHYRKQLQFSWEAAQAAAVGLQNIHDQIAYFEDGSKGVDSLEEEFFEAMDMDLGTPQALAVMQKLLGSKHSTAEKMASLKVMDSILGLGLADDRQKRRKLPQMAYPILEDRKNARLAEDWKKSDELRRELDKLGVDVKDTKEGQVAVLKH